MSVLHDTVILVCCLLTEGLLCYLCDSAGLNRGVRVLVFCLFGLKFDELYCSY